ncbi:MAG: rhodanese-like domain-containing protein [Muribaculaceae bacterium]|nr:rhodanese-like domain-containing protein [Muribaculaceae bacterium]
MRNKLIPLIVIMMSAMQSFGCSHSDNIVSVSAVEFEKAIKADSVQLLDVRSPQEFAEGHIAGAININVQSDDFRQRADKELSKDSTILVYCRSGRRSMDAAETLTELGYKVVNLKGGIIEWNEEGLPVKAIK